MALQVDAEPRNSLPFLILGQRLIRAFYIAHTLKGFGSEARVANACMLAILGYVMDAGRSVRINGELAKGRMTFLKNYLP